MFPRYPPSLGGGEVGESSPTTQVSKSGMESICSRIVTERDDGGKIVRLTSICMERVCRQSSSGWQSGWNRYDRSCVQEGIVRIRRLQLVNASQTVQRAFSNRVACVKAACSVANRGSGKLLFLP